MARTRTPKVTPLSDGERKNLSALSRVLAAASGVFDKGRHLKLRQVEMLIEQGLREDGVPIRDEFRIEDWETMEVRPFSDRRREGHGMIYDTVDNMRLTPKGRAAYERLAAVAKAALQPE